MFTTRSICPPGPVTDRLRFAGSAMSLGECAVLLVGHGSSRRPAAAASLERHADTLRATGVFGEVHTTILIGGCRAPDEVFRRIDRNTIAIVPMMMCAGWTTLQVVPKALRLGLEGSVHHARRIVTCHPIGQQPALAALIARRAVGAARQLGIAADTVTALLVAHGSARYSASHDATELQASRLRATGTFRKVVAAYLEQPPRLKDVLATLPGPTVVIGFFAAPGHHATSDVEALLSERSGDGFTYLGPIGDDHAIPALVRRVIGDHLSDQAASS